MQDVSAKGDNIFQEVSPQYVASIPSGFVEGELGLVYDAAGDVFHLPYMFHNRTNPTLPMPQRTPAQAIIQCTHHFPKLATVIQRYGHMYYHWLEETLPRVVMLQDAGALTPDTKILTWGKPYEEAWLTALGVRSDQIVVYDPEALYCADVLLVPTPVPRITPPKEGLLAVRSALGVKVLPEKQRDVIVYVTRASEPTRRVANEAQLLNNIRAAFPDKSLVVYDGTASPADTITLFQRARVVLGPHGAGLSHILFSAPGTAVIEFLFMADPPMMFWHTAAALGQEYWLLPVPNSYYMQKEMEVPQGEVTDILTAVLGGPLPQGACAPGTAGRAGGLCSACPPGSYAFNYNSKACKLCVPGRVSGGYGGSYCSTCKPGTVSNEAGTACEPCPQGTYSVLAGSSNPSLHCLGPDARRKKMEENALSVEMLSKLSPTFASQIKRRMLLSAEANPGVKVTLSQADICAARTALGSAAGPYLSLSGPYAVDTLCPPIDTSTQVPLTPPPPYGVSDIGLPPIVKPTPTPVPIPVPVPVPNPNDGLRGEPVPDPEQEPETPGSEMKKKKIMDTWVIALIATAVAMVVIPIFVCLIMCCCRRHRRTPITRTPTVGPVPAPIAAAPGTQPSGKAAADGASTASAAGVKKGFAVNNPTFDLSATTTKADGVASPKTKRGR